MDFNNQLIARHVDAVSILLGASVLTVVCQDRDGEVFLLTAPGLESTVMGTLKRIDWDNWSKGTLTDKP